MMLLPDAYRLPSNIGYVIWFGEESSPQVGIFLIARSMWIRCGNPGQVTYTDT